MEEHEAEVQQKSEYQGDELDSYLGATTVNDDVDQGDDASDADASNKTNTNKRRSRKSLVQLKSKYSMMKTASYGAGLGDDAGDVYYVNNETEETHWEKPADFIDEEQERQLEAMADGSEGEFEPLGTISEDDTLQSCFQLLDFYGDAALADREGMLNGDPEASRNPKTPGISERDVSVCG